MAKDAFRCGHPKSLENTVVKDGRARCKICIRESGRRYNKSPEGKANSGRYRKSEKGRKSSMVRRRRIDDKIRNDPVRRERVRKANRESHRRVYEAKKECRDPRNMKGHKVDAKKAAILSDIQYPFEDANALELALRFVEKWKPDCIILDGDIADCYASSNFDRDPLKTDTVLEELHKSEQLMIRLKKIPKKIWLGGNHEDRWRRRLWQEARSAGGLSPILQALMHGIGVDGADPDESFRAAFRTREHGFEYWPYSHFVELAQGNLLVTHGFSVSMHSGYSAKRHYDRLGKSVIIGHTHRQGSYLVSHLWEPRGAWENGCLCRLDPEYVQFPNWQQGFSIVTITEDRFHVDQIPILPDYRIEFGGKTYKL